MSRLFYHVMQDNVGNLLFDVTGTMRLAGSGTLATIYGDEALTVILPNPMTNHPSFGSFKCFLGAGDYDFYMAKGGYTFETLTGVQGHGTMAQQDASAVAITGGEIANIAKANFGGSAVANHRVFIQYTRVNDHGLIIRPTDIDTGGGSAIGFTNVSAAFVGNIETTATATSYNTSSDARFKHAIAPLTGALDVVQALRPVAFRWNSTDELAHGFLAHELQQVVHEAVTGTPDAVDAQGNIVPQGVDHSRLVVWLVAAVQELASRVSSLEEQLGI